MGITAKSIVDALRAEGATVQSLAGVGAGCPDLAVGLAGMSFLIEIKDGLKTPSKRSLTPDQETWIRRWNGSPVIILTGTDQASSWAQTNRSGR